MTKFIKGTYAMNTKPIRKLPELKENQEWACEGGCDVIRPKKFENVFSESYANDGSSINRQSEFYFTCQNNHLLEVWCTDKSDSVLLPEEFYQEEVSKVVQSNSIEESINLLSDDIDSIKDAFIEESSLTNDDAETLELLITRAIQLGELFAIRVAKPQDVPEGFVLIPTIFPESKAQIFAEQEVEAMSKRIDDKFRGGLEFSDEKKAHLIRMNAGERRQIFRDFFKMMSDLELLNDSP